MQIYQDAEKLVKEQFHKGTYDGRGKLDVGAIVGDKLLAKQKKVDGDWHAPKAGVIHVSKLYGCLRGVFYEMMGVPADLKEETGERRMAGVFEAGHLFEDFIVDSLGDLVLERQREYVHKYKSLTLVGHSDYRVLDGEVMRIGENKSVHSDAFWYRKQEGTLIQWHNQIQLNTYLWLERILFGNEWEGIFSYISKDDCTIDHAPVKYNPVLIDEIVTPILDLLNDAFEKAQGKSVEEIIAIGKELPLPSAAVFNSDKGTYGVNWLAKYCNHHNTCAGAGWLLEAQGEVKRLNAEQKASLVKSMGGAQTPTKPVVGVKLD